MNLYPIVAGNFKLDGGAMFGVVPKSLWTRTNPADENNMINMAARCLLIEDGDRLVLVDTGMGSKQSEKFFSFYFMYGDHLWKDRYRSADSAQAMSRMLFLLIYISITVVGASIGMRRERDLNLRSGMRNTGAMSCIGNGRQNQMEEKRLPF